MMIFGVAAVLLPGFVDEISEFLLFSPDVTAVVDPLDPEAKTLAGGVKAAMNLCATNGVEVKLLVAAVPGTEIEFGLNAVRRRCFAKVLHDEVADRSQSSLPPFTPEASPSWFKLEGSGNGGVRLLFKPPDGAGIRLKSSIFRAPFFLSVATVFILATLAVWIAGAKALAAVLPCGAAGLLLARRRRAASPFVEKKSLSKQEWVLLFALFAFTIIQLYKEGVL